MTFHAEVMFERAVVHISGTNKADQSHRVYHV